LNMRVPFWSAERVPIGSSNGTIRKSNYIEIADTGRRF
jgi:hypothetical protein